jgi:sugar phosphate isomerase/epimerase
LQKYAGRSPVVHLKDFVMPGKRPEKMYELIGIQSDKKETEAEAFEFRPLGMGAQDFPKILQACKAAGAQWVVVEQDRPSMSKTAMECAEASLKYLAGIN